MTGQPNDSSSRLVFPRRTVLQAIAGAGALDSASKRTRARVRTTLVPFPTDEQTTVHTASQTDHVVFVAETGFSVHRGSTLSLEWKEDLLEDGETVAATIHDDQLFVFASSGGAELRAYDIEAGEQLWRVSSDEARLETDGKALAGPVYSDGLVYGATWSDEAGGQLTVVDAATGDAVATGPGVDGELYPAEDGVYAVREPDRTVSLQKLDSDGTERWASTGRSLVPALATTIDGSLFVLSTTGDLLSFADSSEPRWIVDLESLLRDRLDEDVALEGITDEPSVAEAESGRTLLSLGVETSIGPYILLLDDDGSLERAVAVDPDDEDVDEPVYRF